MSENSNRIVKNTFFLYFRMLFLMGISLFTSRVILDKLGIEDFGIYNVVGGLASMFTFFSSSLANATQRYLNIALGERNQKKATQTFNQHFVIYLFFVLIIVGCSLTIGLWFVKHKLVIPVDRMIAALYVYYFTIASLCVTFLGIVFNSVIIAHEDMRIYSKVSVLEGGLKLVIVYLLTVLSFDRLIMYSILYLLITLLIQSFYAFYCFRNYSECRIHLSFHPISMYRTLSFIAWNAFGTVIYALKDQGVNILLNIFFGPVVNSARAISYQINSAIISFSTNFFTSVRPQIVKSYATGEYEYLNKLFMSSSKYALYLFWLFGLPMMVGIDTILDVWLKEVPLHTNVFTRWILADSLLALLTHPTWAVVLAIGSLKKYILLGNGCLILIFPLSYALCKMGYDPESVFIVMFFVRILQVFVVVGLVNEHLRFGFWQYYKQVFYPCGIVIFLSGSVTYIVNYLLGKGILSFSVMCLVALFSTTLTIWFLGLNGDERSYVKSRVIKNKRSRNY